MAPSAATHHRRAPIAALVEDDLGDQRRHDLLAVLDDATRILGATHPLDLAAEFDLATANTSLNSLWSAVTEALSGDTPAAQHLARSSDLMDLVFRLQTLRDSVSDTLSRKRQHRLDSVREAVARLHAAGSVRDVLAAAPRIICELGFDRAMLSSIRDSTWMTETSHVERDPAWGAEIVDVGRRYPQKVGPHLREVDVVQRRRTLLVRDAQRDDRVHPQIAEVSLARSYVTAPLVAGANVIGLLHGDRIFHRADVDEFDRSVLAMFSEGLTYALDRLALVDQLDGMRALVNGTSPVGDDRFDLTRRERDVIKLMVAGQSNLQIAKRLVLSESTVKSHVKHILQKLHASNRADAVSRWLTTPGRSAQRIAPDCRDIWDSLRIAG